MWMYRMMSISLIFARADPGDDPGAITTWQKAKPDPRVLHPEGIQKIAEDFEVAKQIPEKDDRFPDESAEYLRSAVKQRIYGHEEMEGM